MDSIVVAFIFMMISVRGGIFYRYRGCLIRSVSDGADKI